MSIGGARTAVRTSMGLAALGWVGEGLFEIRQLRRAFSHRESVPGESKIVEHFAVQHVVFPAVAGGLALAPGTLKASLSPAPARLLAVLSWILVVPETRVSVGGRGEVGDLFRRYPFPIRNKTLKRLELVQVGKRQVNLLQLQHLALNHWLFSGLLTAIAADPAVLDWLGGSRASA